MNNKTNIEEDIETLKEEIARINKIKTCDAAGTYVPINILENILADRERLERENEEIRIKNNAIKQESEAYAERMIDLYNELELKKENQSVSYQTLYDYLISSVDETQKPVWTEEHIEELLDNFIIKWKEKKQ